MPRLSATLILFSLIGLLGRTSHSDSVDPPFSGTIFLDPDIITAADPSVFGGLTFSGQAIRTMFDRRANDWAQVNAYLFDAVFDDGLAAEIQVNPEFGSSTDAMAQATTYAIVVGRLPTSLRKDMQTMWIHKGVEPFGGGNNNILIHVGQAELYEIDGILEETLVHEASHTSLDGTHAASAGWLAAQVSDPEFISTYARDFPDREDIAESFLTFLAVRHRSDRISGSLKTTIEQTIPARIAYFDQLGLDMHPVVADPTDTDRSGELPGQIELLQNYPNPFTDTTRISFSLNSPSRVTLTVVDLTGKQIATLVNADLPAGSHEATWNGRDGSGLPVSAGVYLYSLINESTSGTRMSSRKMVLIR